MERERLLRSGPKVVAPMAVAYAVAVAVAFLHPPGWVAVVTVCFLCVPGLAARWFRWANRIPNFACPRCGAIFLARTPRPLWHFLLPPKGTECQACGLEWGAPSR